MKTGAPKTVKIPTKRPAFMSENKKTGKVEKSNKLLNFVDGVKKSFGGGVFDPYVEVGGGKVRPKIRKGYLGITFEKKF